MTEFTLGSDQELVVVLDDGSDQELVVVLDEGSDQELEA